LSVSFTGLALNTRMVWEHKNIFNEGPLFNNDPFRSTSHRYYIIPDKL
jgi:hypothetical protein